MGFGREPPGSAKTRRLTPLGSPRSLLPKTHRIDGQALDRQPPGLLDLAILTRPTVLAQYLRQPAVGLRAGATVRADRLGLDHMRGDHDQQVVRARLRLVARE